MGLHEDPLRDLFESLVLALAGFAVLVGGMGIGYVAFLLIKTTGGAG